MQQRVCGTRRHAPPIHNQLVASQVGMQLGIMDGAVSRKELFDAGVRDMPHVCM